MVGRFHGDERKFAPEACEFWRVNYIPRSPLYPHTRFLRWLQTDSEENYRLRGNKEFSIESVGYEFNSLGYRGPEFDREPGEAVVMFLGDSNTLGVGMPWEGLWTSLVKRHLEQRWGIPVRQCNFGWGGTGTDYTAMMVHQAVDVLKPDAVFILWSFISRMTWFADTRRQVHFTTNWPPSVEDVQEHSAYLRLATEAHGFFSYIRNFHFVYDRLLRLRIPYFWGNLEQFSQEMLEPYMPLNGFAGPWKRMDLARDGLHAGLKSHEFFATCLISAMDREGMNQPREKMLPIAKWPRDGSKQGQSTSEQRSVLDRMTAFAAQPIRELVGNHRFRRRVRAMRRKDPFIY